MENNPNMFNEVSIDIMAHAIQGFISSTSNPVFKTLAAAANIMRLLNIYEYSSTHTSCFRPLTNYADAFIHTSAVAFNLNYLFDDLTRYADYIISKTCPQEPIEHRHTP